MGFLRVVVLCMLQCCDWLLVLEVGLRGVCYLLSLLFCVVACLMVDSLLECGLGCFVIFWGDIRCVVLCDFVLDLFNDVCGWILSVMGGLMVGYRCR